MNGPIRKLSGYLPVSREVAVDAGIIPDPRTPEQRAADAAHAEQLHAGWRAEREALFARHHAIVARGGLPARLAALHHPFREDPVCTPWCAECGEEVAWWPCASWNLADEAATQDEAATEVDG